MLVVALCIVPAAVLDAGAAADGAGAHDRVERLRRWRSQRTASVQEDTSCEVASADAHSPSPERNAALATGYPAGVSSGAIPEQCLRAGDEAVIFWALPQVEGDPLDANDPGYFSEWGRNIFAPEIEFKSEEVVLQASFCLPPASQYSLDECSVSMQYEGLDALFDTYRLCCSRGCLRLRDTPLAGGGWLRECEATRTQNHEPGQFLMTAVLTCSKSGTRASSGPLHLQKLVHLDGLVLWQQHPWVSHSVASGDALSTATVGVQASFLVHTADRNGSPRTCGGDHILTTLSGPALLHAPAHDLGNGSYLVTYTAMDPGDYQLAVQLTFQRGAGLVSCGVP